MTTPLPQTPGDAREDHAQAVAGTVAAVYAQAELVLIAAAAALARKVAAGTFTPAAAERQLSRTVAAVYAAAQPRVQAALDEAVSDTTAAVRQQVSGDLGDAAARMVTGPDVTALTDSLGNASETAAEDLKQTFAAAVKAAQDVRPEPAAAGAGIFRSTPDAYRYAVEGAIRDTRGGAPYSTLSLSRIQAAQKALDDLADHGITGFTDSAGRKWDLASYVEMATRTAVSNAWDDLTAAAAKRSGLDLALVYTHSTEGSCPHCLPWLGRTISLTGATRGYPTLDEARATGFRHPSCRCSWQVIGAGGMQDVTNPVPIEQAAEAYKASQRQRALERNVRRAQRRAQSAITPQARRDARRDLAVARRVSAEHRAAYGIRQMKVSVRRREGPGAR